MTIPRMTTDYKAANRSCAVILLREALRRREVKGDA